jgi:hypothetical protein
LVPKKLIEEIERWITEKRYGNLQINFTEGRIVNVNRVESVKVTFLGDGVGGVKVNVSQEV